MATFRLATRAGGRGLLSGAAALLLLLRAILAVSVDVPAALGADGATVLCMAQDADGGRGPHHVDDRHCRICVLGDRQRAFDATLPTSEPRAPRRAADVHAFVFPASREGPAPGACGWIGSWSSRAPPRA